MKEVKQYIEYINAIRSNNIFPRSTALLNLALAGFKPNKERLADLIEKHEVLYNKLFNQFITIVIDTGGLSGHAYIENMPIYDWDEQIFRLRDFGFYPGNKSSIGANILYSDGQVNDEVERKKHHYSSISKILDISQEQWEQLGYWASNFKGHPKKYSAFANFIPTNISQSEYIHNCVTTVNAALKEISKTLNLKTLFSPEELSSISNTKHALILHLLGDSKETLTTKCYLDAEYTGTNCDTQVQEQTEKLKETQKINKKQFINETIQTLFYLQDPAKDILDDFAFPGRTPSMMYSLPQQSINSVANMFSTFLSSTTNQKSEDPNNSDSSSDEHERSCKKQRKNARL